MNNHRDKSIMDFNLQYSMQFSSTSRPPLQLHNFMSIPTSTLHANHHHHRHQNEEGRNSSFMKQFWKERKAEVYDASSDVRGAHTLPLARIKKVMKSDEQVKMISGDTPVVLGKACEMLIMELSIRAWMHTQENKRRTLQRNDVANAIRDEDLLASFLKDVVPMETYQEDEDPLSLDNIHNPPSPGGVYVPVPVPVAHPIYPIINMQTINIQAEAAPPGPEGDHPATTNPRLAFPMNFGYNMNNDFLQ